MTYFPTIDPSQRAFRKTVAPAIPIELIDGAGKTVFGKLLTISVNGGCASVAGEHDEGTIVSVKLHTSLGLINGIAMMLKSQLVGGASKQPFRFLALEEHDHNRLQAVLGMN